MPLAAAMPSGSAGLAHHQGRAAVELTLVQDAAGIEFVHRYTRGNGDSIVESAGSGAAWIDHDLDGDVDLVVANGLPASDLSLGDASRGSGHELFRNQEGRFSPAPGHAGIADRAWGNGVAVADVDNDGFADVLITAIGADRLYRNNGDGTFSAVVVGVEDGGWGTSAAFVDQDRDGFVDLYVARYVAAGPVTGPPGIASTDAGPAARRASPASGAGDPFVHGERCFHAGTDVEVFCGPTVHTGEPDLFYRNRGDGTFDRVHAEASDRTSAAGFALVATDCDGDLSPEIYVANDLSANLLYRRTAAGELEELGLPAGVAYSGDGRQQAGMSAAAGDIDGDGRFDLLVTNYEGDHNTLYHAFGDCSFADATARYGLAADGIPFMGWGALFLDVDGDGDEDLFVANGHLFPQLEAAGIAPYGQRNLLYLNRLRETGRAGFAEVGESAGSGMQVIASSRSVIRGDWDDDGDADLLVTNMNAAPTLLRNDSRPVAPALQLTLIGRASHRSAWGARVRVRTGDIEQHFELRGSDGFQGSNDPRLLVHLPGGVADAVTVTWPSGARTELRDQPPGTIVIDEVRGVIARRGW